MNLFRNKKIKDLENKQSIDGEETIIKAKNCTMILVIFFRK